MPYETLYIFVEGPDDERFTTSIILPLLRDKFSDINGNVEIIKMAGRKDETIDAFLKSISASKNKDYLMLVDLDSANCVSGCKDLHKKRYRHLDQDKTVVVIKEIEGWYVAGLDANAYRSLGLRGGLDPNTLTKENFEAHTRDKFGLVTDAKIEILKCFDVPTAEKNSRSFKYLIDKHCTRLTAT